MRRVVLATMWVISASTLGAATFTVINTDDSGAGSLRQAILDANAAPGLDTIAFNIPGAGVHTIAPTSALPTIADPMVIDGYTQPGSSPNSDPAGFDGVLLIELSGADAGNATGLHISAGGSTVRGLVINRFTGTYPAGSGIHLVNAGGNLIVGNLFGTDPGGTLPRGVEEYTVIADLGSGGNTVGGTTPDARNVIADSGKVSLFFYTSGNVVQGNFIGTQRDGLSPLGNLQGVAFGGSESDDNIVGGTAAGEANVIAFNEIRGVVGTFDAGSGNTVRGNSIYGNGELGIDWIPVGVEANDAGDADSGPNDLQNFPIIRSVEHLGPQGAGGTRIVGKLHSTASTTFDLDFYANSACFNFPREFIEGQVWLGTSPVTTDASGNAAFDVTLPIPTEAGARIAATATNPSGSTSQFSQRIVFSIDPVSGPDTGGSALNAFGTDFSNPTMVTIGGVSGNPVFVSSTQLGVTAPPFDPGTAHDVVTTTTDGTTATLIKGWVANFLDVPAGHQFIAFVTTLISNGITSGVGGGNYGVDQPTLRQQMAVFLLKAKHGLCYVPPPCQSDFADVPCPSTFADWIEALADEGISGGCGGGNFCPTNPVRRDQMAPFLLKARHGSSYVPPVCTGLFDDVTCPSLFADWIEQLNAESITGGCGGNNYCPLVNATRGQMAVFVVKTFGLQ